jgi:D-xylose 1-dehydrogenase (NADP+, D-xylono-1,5-lactone-forming)
LYIGEVEDLADCILKGKTPRIPLADSRANVAAILALLESAKTGRAVKP